MGIKYRLTVLNFLQFFVWGSWLLTIGAYWFNNKHWSGASFGTIFSTMGFASLFMPALAGIIADKWINAEKLYGLFHLLGGIALLLLPQTQSPQMMIAVMMINMIFYMPTISLSITIAYTALKNKNLEITTHFPPIRVWGTIGFIVALWTVSLLGFETSANQFYVAAFASIALGIYSFSMPACPPMANKSNSSFIETLGLNAFKLFKEPKMAIFFLFAMLLGASLQLTNAYGDTFLHDFGNIPSYKDLIAVKYPAIIMSISQISETLFIIFIPFFMKKFGIKNVMLMSMFAWVLRFGLFAYGNPADGLWMIIISCIVYGMAFDFFNVSGSLFVESQSDASIRGSVQGLFMMMVNGIGAVLGSTLSGLLITTYFTAADGTKDWHHIWLCFAGYSLVIAILFGVLFRHKHEPIVDFKH